MKHKNMSYEQREKLSMSVLYSKGLKCNFLTQEPYIECDDGTKIYIDEVEE
jgi:hypothetical protein